MLNIAKAWQYSTGNGVPVAVIDTGVNPSPRLPVVSGGDYIMGGDGLTDCDAHGTIVALADLSRSQRGADARPDAAGSSVSTAGRSPPTTGAPLPPGSSPPVPAPEEQLGRRLIRWVLISRRASRRTGRRAVPGISSERAR